MTMWIATAAISLIACHGGPADHFAAYTDVLTQQGEKWITTQSATPS